MHRFAIRPGLADLISMALLAFMGVCLAFALAGEGIDLAWLNQPVGNIAGDVADGFAWAFAVALIAEFVLVASGQRPPPRGRRSYGARHGLEFRRTRT